MLTRADVVDLVERYGIAPSRALGQNFVVDPNTVRRIAGLAEVGPGDCVVEIGAGLGSLTLALAETGADITAIEADRYLMPALEETTAGRGIRLVHDDATALDWTALLSAAPRWKLVANLPYNIATPLVADLLDTVPVIDHMLVMVQREVAERLVAVPGSRDYGIPSVKVAYWAEATLAGQVSPNVFLPRPKVESALVRIVRREAPAVDAEPGRLFTLVRAGFGQRRKMLRRALAGLVAQDAFSAAGVRPEARAEELDVEAWGRLAATPTPADPS